MKIQLTQGQFTEVSDSNPRIATVVSLKWHAAAQRGGGFYAARNVRLLNGKRGLQLLHVYLMNPPKGLEVDHINGNKLDNRDENLRLVNRAGQVRGFQRKVLGASSRFRGVCWDCSRSLWMAYIRVGEKLIHLGRFGSEVEAARARDAATRKYFGGAAQFNFL